MKDETLYHLTVTFLHEWREVQYIIEDMISNGWGDEECTLNRDDLWEFGEKFRRSVVHLERIVGILADYLEEKSLCKSNYIKDLRKLKLPFSKRLEDTIKKLSREASQ